MTADVWYLSARELGALLRQREVSALEVVQAMLSRIGSLDSRFNAFITVTADEAQDMARRLDAELADGKDRGPLHGIPVAIKDLYDTAGVRTTSGSKILANNVPDNDATSVAKLRTAGAIIIGKTNLNEFACGVTTTNAHYGDTHNPWKPACIPAQRLRSRLDSVQWPQAQTRAGRSASLPRFAASWGSSPPTAGSVRRASCPFPGSKITQVR